MPFLIPCLGTRGVEHFRQLHWANLENPPDVELAAQEDIGPCAPNPGAWDSRIIASSPCFTRTATFRSLIITEG